MRANKAKVVTFGYNAVGQLTSVTSDDGTLYVASTTYDAQGQVIEQRLDSGTNGFTRQSVYNPNTLRLETLKAGTASPFDNLQQLAYTYDLAGNVQTLTDATNVSQTQTFGYDWLDRLTVAATNAAGVGPYSHTYAYNAIGNLTNYNGNAYTYGSQPHAVTSAFGKSYGYDAVGNQTSRIIAGSTYTQTFDYDNRLTTVAGGSVSASFVYDADGNRVMGTVAGVTTVYIAGLYEWQNGAVTKYYEGGAIRRMGYANDNGVFYVVSDHLRSTSVLVNQNGTVKDRNYYYPYGGNRGGSAFSGITTKRYTGQYHEQELPGGEGLSYYNARWYDAQVGVFISADTLVPSPMSPQTLNRYAYVSGNPLRYVDPTGHAQCRTVEDCADLGETPMGTRPYVPKPPVGVWKPSPQAWSKTPVPATWVWPNGRFNAVQYTLDEMRTNTVSPHANGMRYLISDPFTLPTAYIYWIYMVAPSQPWDHKAMIRFLTEKLEPYNDLGGWQQVGNEEYYYDTWSNIHYGYVGRAIGMTEQELLAGASVAQAADDLITEGSLQYYSANDCFMCRFDDPADQAAIALGSQLWDAYGATGGPTPAQFIEALAATPGLVRQPNQGGRP